MWKLNNPKLNLRQACEAFVAECFEGRAVDWGTFKPKGDGLTATFSLVDGVKVFEITSFQGVWHCASQT